MCLGIPGQIISLNRPQIFNVVDALEPSAQVRFGGVTKEVNLAFTPDATVGDYVIVHVGFAISILDEKRAEEIYETLEALGALELPPELSEEER